MSHRSRRWSSRAGRIATLLMMLTLAMPASAPAAQSIRGLPLTEVPATTRSEKETFAILISGDGGFANIGRTVADGIAADGIPVVGLNSLRYFWTKRSIDQTSEAIAAIMRHYLDGWGKRRVILIGYSFGADVLPFAVNKLPPDLRDRIALVALLGLSTDATFEFHAANWVGFSLGETFPTAPEMAKLSGLNVLCVYGVGETESLCPHLAQPATVVQFRGGHHFAGDYARLVHEILAAAR